MKFLLIVLNRVEKLNELLDEFVKHGVCGATILNSRGMARELARNNEELPFFGALRKFIDMEHQESKTIFMVLRDEQLDTAKSIVRKVVGDLSQPDTAVMFTLPVLSAEGVCF